MLNARLSPQPVKAIGLLLVVGVAFLFSAVSFAASSNVRWPKAAWQDLAKKVGTSEDVRDAAITQLKTVAGLNSKLKKAIYTSDRPLALDVISALDLKEMIPDLLLHVPADPDGFLTVAVNAMMTDKNQTQILNSYQENLAPEQLTRTSPGAIVAMLEPLGRLAIKLPKQVVRGLSVHTSPEVRSSLLYYLRMMALRHGVYENLDLVADMLRAKEFQIRLQAVSVSAEVLALTAKTKVQISGSAGLADLKTVCEAEKAKQIREACMNFIANGEAK